ncbi:copia protein [Lasius niger]|uniref:Copia protein n=1 Tax=Lasius niger TaxID=67767 RepID=A0A0J7KUL9_LASNI|nr:copia protein [Lasius niger]
MHVGRTTSPQALLHIINCESATEMWNKLKSVYEQKSEASIHMLQQMWYSAKMSRKDNIASHVAKLEDIAHKLEVIGDKVSDNMIITKLLMTLPHSYNHFVSAWESAAQTERTLANLTSMLTIEEMRHSAAENPKGSALATDSSKSQA